MALPWVRLDANFASHDKVLALAADPSAARWQAITSYLCSLGWSGAQGTDGYVPSTALPFIHGNARTARLLVKYGFWDEDLAGFRIRNYEQRQELAIVAEAKAAGARAAGRKGNCIRHHGKDCGCWRISPEGVAGATR